MKPQPEVEGGDALTELALNLHWSWNHAADELWQCFDPQLWEDTQNPWVILRTVSTDKVKSLMAQPEFRQRADDLLRRNRESFNSQAWFQKKYPDAALTSVAYFSMEFMLSEALPIYSGELGNVAGDQMKAASEACGTSGMKVLVNGGLNLSELDGWWAEAYSPKVGWAIGDGREHGYDPEWDAQEAETLYTLLKNGVIPEFYQRDEKGMPSKWLARIRECMATLTPEFSASRAIREYTETHYLPAAAG